MVNDCVQINNKRLQVVKHYNGANGRCVEMFNKKVKIMSEQEEKETIEQAPQKQADVVIERHRTPSSRETMPSPGRIFKLIFGFVMAGLYILMGLWMSGWIDFGQYGFPFGFDGTNFEWIKHVVGAVVILYGVFRGYRYVKGDDYYTRK